MEPQRWGHCFIWRHNCGSKVKLVVQVLWSRARIGCSAHPMGASQNRKTIVLKVRVKSGLFLVGPALLAISVSRRAERRGQDSRGRTFFLCNLPPISLFSFPPRLKWLLTTAADLSITSRHVCASSDAHGLVQRPHTFSTSAGFILFGLGLLQEAFRCSRVVYHKVGSAGGDTVWCAHSWKFVKCPVSGVCLCVAKDNVGELPAQVLALV